MVLRPSRPQAGSSPLGGPSPSSDPVHGPARLATTVSSTGGGGTGGGGTGGTGGDCKGGAGGGPSTGAGSSGPSLLMGSSSMPAASPGRLSAADFASSPSAADAAFGIGKRSRQASRQGLVEDAPIPASVPGRQEATGGQGSTPKRPKGVEQPLLPQVAPAGPSAEGPSGIPSSIEDLSPPAGAACKRSWVALGSDIRATGSATERGPTTGGAQVVQTDASSQVQALYILLEGDPNKRYGHAVIVRMLTE